MRNYIDVNRIYRDTANSKVSGVCAGLARHWGVDKWIVRAGAVASLIFLPTVTVIAYITAVILLPKRV